MAINIDKIELRIGDRVKHRLFGEGEILKADGDLLEISFTGSIKTLSKSTCLDKGLLGEAGGVVEGLTLIEKGTRG